MAFNVDLERKKREELFDKGELKNCRRSGCKVRLYPPDTPEFRKNLRAKLKKARHELGLIGRKADQPLPDETFENALLDAVAEVLMGGWEDIVDQDGNPVLFSVDIAKKFLREPALSMFREDVLEMVNAMGEFESEEREVLSGN